MADQQTQETDAMADEALEGMNIAILVTDGFEQVN